MHILPTEIVEFNPRQQPIDAAVIWLHGLGASGDDFVPVVPELGLREDMAVRFVFPYAPKLPVTINGGYVMPAWYDIYTTSIDREVDKTQLRDSAAAIGELIEQQIEQGIASERIIIAGFSQGGAVAYETVLSYPERLGGLIALSTYFATVEDIRLSPANTNLPILIAHGSADDVVPELLGQRAVAQLSELGYAPSYHTYPMAHSVCMEEIDAIGAWLVSLLAE